MCGRYTHKFTWQQIHRLLDLLAKEPIEVPSSFNVAPTQMAPIVLLKGSDHHRELVNARWGLVPSWAEDPKIGSTLINARSETAATKPAFRSAFKRHRCIVLASGFYEWKKGRTSKAPKQPFYIQRADQKILCFAGLFEHWTHAGEDLLSYTIMTTTANEFMSTLHDRMPVVLEPETVGRWLDPDTAPEQLSGLLAPAADGVLSGYPVSRRVNSPKVNDPTLIEPAAGPDADFDEDKSGNEGGLFG